MPNFTGNYEFSKKASVEHGRGSLSSWQGERDEHKINKNQTWLFGVQILPVNLFLKANHCFGEGSLSRTKMAHPKKIKPKFLIIPNMTIDYNEETKICLFPFYMYIYTYICMYMCVCTHTHTHIFLFLPHLWWRLKGACSISLTGLPRRGFED